MKAELVKLFAATPTLQPRSPEFLDDLAEDVQAVVIRALELAPAIDPQLDALENAVQDLYVSEFGVTLNNLIVRSDYPHKEDMPHSVRYAAVKAMLQTLLLEQASHFDVSRGAAMRTRLESLAVQ